MLCQPYSQGKKLPKRMIVVFWKDCGSALWQDRFLLGKKSACLERSRKILQSNESSVT